jgi:hypothetical protein
MQKATVNQTPYKSQINFSNTKAVMMESPPNKSQLQHGFRGGMPQHSPLVQENETDRGSENNAVVQEETPRGDDLSMGSAKNKSKIAR